MLAFVLEGYGGPAQTELRELPVPSPAARQVLVQVYAAGLNPTDYKTRQGRLRNVFRYHLPIIMGKEFAGIVVDRGTSAARFAIGAHVFGRVAQDSMGAFAEYIAINEDLLARMPTTLDFVSAAGVPLAGVTALQGLRDELKVTTGQHILILGGAGGVGTFAIQLAKLLGAEVATTASPRGEALVRALGADQVIDYTRDDFRDHVHDFDGVFDLMGHEELRRAFEVVRRGGRVVSITGPSEPKTALADLHKGLGLAASYWAQSLPTRFRAYRHGVHYRRLFMHPDGTELAELGGLIEAGRLRVVQDSVFPFSEIGRALAHLEDGHAKGKVIVRLESG